MARFFIRTYGCQMNERDSEALSCLLEERGYCRAESEESADILLFNTCSVRDQAERKVLGKIGLLKRLKKRRPEVVIGLVGCMAQVHGESLVGKLPHVDLIVSPDHLGEIPDLLEEIRSGGRRVVLGEEPAGPERFAGHEPGRVTASVAVMRGCNQFCSYCIVPYARGRERSRPIDDIVEEVRAVTRLGAREVLLLGQNITAYGLAEARRDGTYTPELSPFADLLRAVHRVEGLHRIRFTSPHVAYMNAAFIEAVCTLPKVCKAFHIPVQSGSDRVLRRMRRGYTVAEYLRCLEAIRAGVPECNVSTDCIVGFPGETEEDFQATREVFRAIDPDMAYIFRYSPRKGTKAAVDFEDDVPEAVKHERNQILLADLEANVLRRNQALLGRRLTILVEGPSKRNPARWQGRSDGNKTVVFTPTDSIAPGDMVDIVVRRVTSHSLFGECCEPEKPDRSA